jgi:hypothetical protein
MQKILLNFFINVKKESGKNQQIFQKVIILQTETVMLIQDVWLLHLLKLKWFALMKKMMMIYIQKIKLELRDVQIFLLIKEN